MRQHGRARVPQEIQFKNYSPVYMEQAPSRGQGRASVGGASVELLRVVVVVVVVPLLLLVVDFGATCAASYPGSMDDEVPAAVKQEAGPPLVGLRGPTPSRCAACT